MTDPMTDAETRRGDLDPENWAAFTTLAEKTLRRTLQALQEKPDGPVWQKPPSDAISAFDGDLPRYGLGAEQIAEHLHAVLPYGVGNTHPRFFGWVHGAGSPGNLLAEIVTSGLNANCGGRHHLAINVERQTVDWCKALFGFPSGASGLIVSGTSMATIIAAKVARDRALSFASRTDGVQGHRLVGYVSEQAHSCLDRAFDMIGLGTAALRKIPVDADHQIDLPALRQQIANDRAGGAQPFFLAATVGTVNTGAIDPLQELAAIAESESLWFHVDGAFGASLMLSAPDRARLRGIERADSLAFDFHKWMHVNYEAGCVLVRDGDAHRRAFANRPDYLAADGLALAAGEPWPVDFGPELSRGFRALKVWAHFLEHGSEKLGQSIRKNCEQAAYLAAQVDADPVLERLAPCPLNICCFRYRGAHAPGPTLDALNANIVATLQARGIAAPSTTRLGGALAIRVNITNHRTQMADLDILLCGVRDIAAELDTDALS